MSLHWNKFSQLNQKKYMDNSNENIHVSVDIGA